MQANPGLQGRLDLSKGDLRLGLECHVVRHARSGSPSRVVDLGLGQVEPVGDRQAGVVSGNRQRDRDLAVVLLAELAAILAGDTSVAFHLLRRRNLGYSANRVSALLRHAGCSYRNETDSPAKMVQGRFVIRRGAHEHVGDQIRLDRTWFASAF